MKDSPSSVEIAPKRRPIIPEMPNEIKSIIMASLHLPFLPMQSTLSIYSHTSYRNRGTFSIRTFEHKFHPSISAQTKEKPPMLGTWTILRRFLSLPEGPVSFRWYIGARQVSKPCLIRADDTFRHPPPPLYQICILLDCTQDGGGLQDENEMKDVF